jgi:hypothetical protein
MGGGHHTRRVTKVDVRHLVDRMARERLFRHTANRGSDDETVKSVKDWIYEGQAILEEGVYWNRFVSTSLRDASTGDEDEEMAYDTAE